jgi:DNA-binding beta-propeller fold protein YncE
MPFHRGLCLVALLAAATAAVSGCGATAHRPSTPGAASAPHVPNPFKIIARYSSSSLGLKRPMCHGQLGGCGERLAVGPNGDVYVTDPVTSTVTRVSPAGKVIHSWGRPGTGPGEFHFVTKDQKDPSDIADSLAVGPDGKVYVSDSGNGRVEVFSPSGAFLRRVGGSSGTALLVLPYDVAVDQQSDLYVVDQAANTISKFSPSGKLVWQAGGATSSDPELSQTEFHLAGVDSHGRVVAAASDAKAIVYIDSSGHKVDSFPVRAFPHGLAPCGVSVDAAGYTFVESCGFVGESGGQPGPPNRSELVFDRTHHLVGAWYDSPFAVSPSFGPHGEAFTLGDDGSILRLKVALPGA